MRLKDLGTRPAPATLRNLLSRIVRGHGPAIPVERREVPYWQERGWTRNGNRYVGAYQTQYGAFRGEIIEHRRSDIDFFLYQPSDAIRQHSHWACFQERQNGWFLIHMGRRPKDVSSGILTIERLVAEAHES